MKRSMQGCTRAARAWSATLASCARILAGTHCELSVAILPRALGANVRERNVPVTKAQRRAEACKN